MVVAAIGDMARRSSPPARQQGTVPAERGRIAFCLGKGQRNHRRYAKDNGNPKYLSNLETVAQALIENMSKGDPKAYEMFSARVKGMER